VGANYVALVFSGWDYMVNVGRSEAEEFGLGFCHKIVDKLMRIMLYKPPFFRKRSGYKEDEKPPPKSKNKIRQQSTSQNHQNNY